MTPETKKEPTKDPLTVFLDSVTNKNTRSGYERGITMFLDYTKKTVGQILAERKEDLIIKPNEDLVTQKQRANRFEREYLEPFYNDLICTKPNREAYRPNTAAKYTDGILRLLNYYSMGLSLRNGSPISEGHRGVGETRFPMKIEHVRQMFWKERDLMYKVALALGVDFQLG